MSLDPVDQLLEVQVSVRYIPKAHFARVDISGWERAQICWIDCRNNFIVKVAYELQLLCPGWLGRAHFLSTKSRGRAVSSCVAIRS